MAAVNTYTAHARKWEGGWELHIDGVGVTQSRTLRDAERMVRSYVCMDTGADRDSFAVEILPDLAGLETRVRQVRATTARAEAAQRKAATMTRAVVRDLKARGLSGNDIAAVLNVSPQRVSQLAKSEQSETRSAKPARSATQAATSTRSAKQAATSTRSASRSKS
jgi:predicted XRE-type DNA-binding protein